MRGLTQPEPNVSATQETAVVREAAREEISCACGCGRKFEPSKPWHRFSSEACRRRNWRDRWLRRRPARRAAGASDASERIPARVYSRRYVETGCIRKALELIARTNPEVLLNLLAAVESPARSRIELAG